MVPFFKTSILLTFTLCVYSCFSQTSNIYQWRGANRDGKYTESNLLKSWKPEGPELLWFSDSVGNGYGSPTITKDKVYINGEIDSIAYLFAFDLKGNLLWKTNCSKEWVKTFPGSRSAPTVADNLVYVCTGLGNMYCFDAINGKKMWSLDMFKDFHGQYIYHGHSESPLVDGNKVFMVPGGKDTSVVAIDRFSGKILWAYKGNGERPAYNSPYIIKLPQRSILVTFTAYTLLGIDANTGELLWTHAQDNVPVAERTLGNGDTHSNTVLYDNGFIYYSEGDGNCAVKLELLNDGKAIKQVWRNKAVDNYMGGFIKIDNYIYSCTNSRRNLVSMDASTGMVTDSLKCGIGTIIMADNMLYYYNQTGKVFLIKPDLSKMEIISSFKINKGTKEHFAHQVISDGKMYIRHGKSLLVYNIKSE
ncbi:MAG: PQQ-binding-like beta-propeller repeat protein [Bacteroidota bacterium]